MFFPKLRRHAKWMFVFLALAFGVGFVVFGIGASGQGASIGDLLRDGSGADSDAISVSDAREKVAENPKDANAQLDLATALQQEGKQDEAIVALNRYLELRPKDEDALRELAALYLSRATRLQRAAQEAQALSSYLTAGSIFRLPLDVGGDSVATQDPIELALSTKANQAVTEAYTASQSAFQQAEQTYERLAEVAPNDPNVQLELAQTAQQSGDYAKAIAAYEDFLKLAPDDPSAPIVRQQIKQLQAAQAPAASG
ncbi:MAG: tetratricopeptide repeat protein [Actinobacteria bacterium]|nr:tetratricopeptide repeat protein [Actinomycetota bacterium]